MKNKESGVSPVIGVLLMLTLTLIIAAIVNMYAGSLVTTDPKPPTVTLQVSYNSADGMTVRHISGDPIPMISSQFMIRPGESMGPKYQQYPITLNQSDFSNYYNTSIKVGDIVTITKDKLKGIQENNKVSGPYLISNISNIGNTFNCELYYKNSLISRNEVLIQP